MRIVVGALCVLLTSPAFAQTASPAATESVKEDIRALFRELSDAAVRRDQAALERLHAPEFLFVHGLGYLETVQERVDEAMTLGNGRALAAPSFEAPNEFHVFGDVAVLRVRGNRGPGRPTLGTTIYAKRNGRWQIVQVQTTELLPERQGISLSTAALDAFVGRYDFGAGGVTAITREGDVLVVRHPAFPARRLTPTEPSMFFDKTGGEWTFIRDGAGNVTHALLRARGQETKGTRIE